MLLVAAMVPLTLSLVAAALQPAQTPPVKPATPAAPAPAAAPSVPAAPANSGTTPGKPAIGNFAPAPTVEKIEPFAARALVRSLLVDIRLQSGPGPQDYTAAAIGLSEAAALSLGGNAQADFLRLALAAAQEAGDTTRTLDICKRLVQADPRDTAAQLQLIEARASQGESIDGRLSVYEAVLGARGNGIDDSVRSRIALSAALIAKQRGDAKKYGELLSKAAALDGSNKQAASLILDFFSERVSDPVGRVELLTNLLIADPLDARTHTMLASEFAAASAPASALRFFDNAEQILARLGDGLPTAQAADRWLQIAKVRGPATVVRQLTDTLDAPRREAQQARDAARLNGNDPKQLPDPMSIRLAPEMERIRFACALAGGDKDATTRSLADFAAYAADFSAGLKPDDAPVAPAELELAFMRLWSNTEIDLATAQIARFEKANVPAEALARLQALKQHRAGDSASARAVLSADGMKNDALAMVALAQVEIDAGATAEVVDRLLLNIMTFAPGTPSAAWAHGLFAVRTGAQPPQPPLSERFSEMARGIPKWVDDVARDPSRFVTLLTSPVRETLDAVEPAEITIRLRHTLPVPVSFGPGDVIDSRLLLTSLPDFGRGLDTARAVSEVLNLDRRLRLEPREELAAVVWAEPGAGGWSSDSAMGIANRVRFRLVNGFQMINGSPQVVGFGGASEAGPVLRAGPGSLETAGLLAAIKADQGRAFARTMLAARRALLDAGGPGAMSIGDAQQIASAIAARYATEGAAGRVLILCQMPVRGQSVASGNFEADIAATAETDRVVKLARLLTRAGTPGDAFLAASMNDADADVAKFAAALSGRLSRSGGATFATLRTTLPPTAAQPSVGTPEKR